MMVADVTCASPGGTERLGGEGHQRRTKLFALAVQRVIGIRLHAGIKRPHLLRQARRNRIQKRLDRTDNLFPESARRGIWRFGDGRGYRLRSSS